MHLTASSALWSRRRLDGVLGHLMRPLRAEGSASVPAVVCASCATSLGEHEFCNYNSGESSLHVCSMNRTFSFLAA